MEWIVGLFFAFVVVGLGIAIYERRKKTVVLKHDLHLLSQNQTETDRENARAIGAMRDRIMFDHIQ
jgi:hypothetical protein